MFTIKYRDIYCQCQIGVCRRKHLHKWCHALLWSRDQTHIELAQFKAGRSYW